VRDHSQTSPPAEPAEPTALPGVVSGLRHLLPLFMLAAFGVAIWVLWRALSGHSVGEVRAYLDGLPVRSIAAAAGFTAASYVMLVGYDLIALRYIGRSVPLSSVALTSFISYAFTNTLGAGGFGTLTGGSVRYRLYAAEGLSGLEITAVIAFSVVTFFVGLMLVGGLTLFFQPQVLAGIENLPPSAVRAIGIAMVVPVGVYLAASLLRRRAFEFGAWRLRIPSFELALAQVALSSLDLALAGAALYELMPRDLGLNYPAFMGLYVVALVGGVVSHVPGGLGVFEGLLIALLPETPAAATAGALLSYRLVYYLLPLALAAVLLTGSEVSTGRARVAGVVRFLHDQWARVAPQITAFAALLCGTILLISGATPGIDERIDRVEKILPLGLLEASHLIGSIVGVGLLLLSRALLRRLDSAYILTMGLLVVGAVASLLKGLDYEEAIILSVSALLLVPARRAFYRHGVFVQQRFSGEWVSAVIVVIVGTIWLGLFAYRNVDYAHALWWQFEFSGDAPRFLRASVAVILVAMGYAAFQLLRPVPPVPPPPGSAHVERLLPLVTASTETRAALALAGDKHILFADQGDGFVMYGVRGRSWVSMGDPVGPPERLGELAWKFRELCDQHDGVPVFYQVAPENLPLYLDLGLTLLKLGDEARVRLAAFDIDRPGYRDLRYGHRRSQREGGTFAVVPAADVPALLPELRAVSDAWIADRSSPEKGFSVGFFDADYLGHFPCAIVRKDGRIVAFSNVWAGAAKEEISVDLMRYLPGALYGVMDFLFVELMLWAKAEGYRWFNLGMAPLSGLGARHLSPVWYRFGAMAYRYGDQFYNFQGLRKYKEKFHPEWRPRFLACPGGLALPRVLIDVAALISGGVRRWIRA
jgi:phosphatidylglycerol lysyltransferase